MPTKLDELRLEERKLTMRIRQTVERKQQLEAELKDLNEQRLQVGQQIIDEMEGELADIAGEK